MDSPGSPAEAWADHDGYKIYVWGSDHDPDQDSDAFYAKLISEGADSYNTPSPTTLAAYLCTAGIAKPDGTPRCPGQVCPEGQTGIAPDHCVDIPKCPEGTEGTPPNCTPIIAPPDFAKVSRMTFKPKKGKLKAGKKAVLRLSVASTGGKPNRVTIRLKSSNRNVKVQPKLSFVIGPKTVTKRITVRVKRGAKKGRVKITAISGKVKASASRTVNPVYQGSGQSGQNPLHQ